MKRALRKSLGRSRVSTEHLTTLLVEIESVLNSRPLTSLPTDSDGVDVLVLTPNHFLNPHRPIGIPIAAVPPCESTEDPDFDLNPSDSSNKVLDHWKRQQTQLNQFWKIWTTDYLAT